jgi:transposase-like protein
MTRMKKTARAQYTLEFKQEAVRLVESGQSIAAAARQLNHYRLKAVGCLTTESRGTRLKPSEVFPAQSRLKARQAR